MIKTPIVEVKNLNSFRAVERAVKFEAQRQYEEALRDSNYRMGKVSKATAGWDEHRGATIVQRRKEEASDYRYFPEPDLVPVVVDAAWLDRARAAMGELPAAQRVRLAEQYGLSAYDVGVLTLQGRALVAYFEEVAHRCGDAKTASNWITNKLLATLNERKEDLPTFLAASQLTAERLAGLLAEQKAMGFSKTAAEEVYNRMVSDRIDAKTAIAQLGIKAVDAGALVEVVRRAIAANAKAVADFKAGKTKAAQAIKGAVMREIKGAAKPEVVEQLILEEIGKSA